MKKLLIATHNKGKIGEFQQFLSDLPVPLVSLADIGITKDMEEDGKTYEENSQKKAIFYATQANLPAIADDGGFEIAFYGGAPGIKSRRWLGYEATDEELIKKMHQVAKELPKDNRDARFVTVVSFALPSGKVWSTQGIVEGVIAEKPLLKIAKGYPYRSFFFLPQLKKFYFESELTPAEMKEYNHRYKAVEELKKVITKHL